MLLLLELLRQIVHGIHQERKADVVGGDQETREDQGEPHTARDPIADPSKGIRGERSVNLDPSDNIRWPRFP